jgi:hypothetical protein
MLGLYYLSEGYLSRLPVSPDFAKAVAAVISRAGGSAATTRQMTCSWLSAS